MPYYALVKPLTEFERGEKRTHTRTQILIVLSEGLRNALLNHARGERLSILLQTIIFTQFLSFPFGAMEKVIVFHQKK